MAKITDRSKYRNPDMPVGYIKKEAELKYKEGIEVNGVHYIWAHYIWSTRMYEREDYEHLSEFQFSDIDEIVEAKEQSPVSPDNTEKEKASTVKQKVDETDSAERKKSKHGKKGHHSRDTSDLDASLSHMDINPEKQEKQKKTKRVKKDHKNDYSYENRNKKSRISVIACSPSSPEPTTDVKIKEEPLEEPQHIFGYYHCDVCNLTLSSLKTYNAHINGKRHIKNLNLVKVPKVTAQSIPHSVVSEDLTRYPKPPHGVTRKTVQTASKIQHIIEQDVTVPCPGLSNVIEIQGIGGVQYYCATCDSLCSYDSILPHLTGYKHQLGSVKYFKPGAYEYMSYEPKYKIEKEVLSILRAIQKRDGMGKIKVEVEEFNSGSQYDLSNRCQPSTSNTYSSQRTTSKDQLSQPSTSRGTGMAHSGMLYPKSNDRYNKPIKSSATDFICELCECHMNSIESWESHVNGKRHRKNLRAPPGDLLPKSKIFVPNRKAFLLERLRYECPGEPIVGLNHIREIELPENNSYSYYCFLCSSSYTFVDIVEHVLSFKHRTKYLDNIKYPEREVIKGMKELTANTLVRDMCIRIEDIEGQGEPTVYVSKSAKY